MAGRRVAITGMGVVTPAGIGVDALWQNLLAGTSGVKPVALFDAAGFTCRIAAQLDD